MKDIRSKLFIGMLLAIAVIVGLLIYTDLQDIEAYVQNFPVIYLIPIVGFTLHNYFFRWIKWQMYLKLIGVEGLSWVDSAGLWISAFVLVLSPGKVGEFLKSASLRFMTGAPITRTAPVIIGERITDGIGMLILAAIGFGGILLTSAENNDVLISYLPAYFAVLGIIMVVIAVIQIRPVVLWGLTILDGLPLVSQFSKSIRELYESSYEIFRPKPLAVAIALGVVSWAGECIGFYFILDGMGIEPSWLLLWQSTFILAAATIIGAISGLPGGLGAAELSIAGMLQLIVLEGASNPGFAGTATIFVRISTLWFAVVLGLVTALIFRKRIFPDKRDQSWRRAQHEQEVDTLHG